MDAKNVARIRGCVPKEDVLEKLGEGTFGAVFKIAKGGKTYALKTYDPSRALSPDNLVEIDVLTKARHPYVLRAVNVELRECGICLTLPLAETDLYKWLWANPLNGNLDALKYRLGLFYKIVCGLHYLHANRIVHQDLKPANILIIGGEPKIADFGAASLFPHSRIKFKWQMGTPTYTAPEIMASEEYYTAKIDVWSMGVIFYQMVTDTELTHISKSSEEYLLQISQRIGPLTTTQSKNLPRAALDETLRAGPEEQRRIFSLVPDVLRPLTLKMLERDPRKRLDTGEIRAASVFAKFPCSITKIENVPVVIAPSVVYIQTREPLLKQMKGVVDARKYGDETFFLAADILDRYASADTMSTSYLPHMIVSMYLAAGIYQLNVENIVDHKDVANFSAGVCAAVKALNFKIFRPTIDLYFPGVDTRELVKCIMKNISPDSVAGCMGAKVPQPTRMEVDERQDVVAMQI